MINNLIDKADVLIEALPYLQSFRGETVVIKLGGSAMENAEMAESVLTDISFMSCVGMHPVVVHGGGKAISKAMREAGLETKFVSGLRVTDAESVQIVERVLNREISPSIVRAITQRGMLARTLPGPSIIRSQKFWERDAETGEKLDLGFVGEVVSVDPRPIHDYVNQGVIPVISPLGLDEAGNIYNNNADVAAAEVAIAVRARKLVFLSDVHGIMRVPGDKSSFISSLHSSELDGLVAGKVISGGMLPKVLSGIKATKAGVKKTHIVDGNLKHSLLLELFTNEGIGTEIVG